MVTGESRSTDAHVAPNQIHTCSTVLTGVLGTILYVGLTVWPSETNWAEAEVTSSLVYAGGQGVAWSRVTLIDVHLTVGTSKSICT